MTRPARNLKVLSTDHSKALLQQGMKERWYRTMSESGSPTFRRLAAQLVLGGVLLEVRGQRRETP